MNEIIKVTVLPEDFANSSDYLDNYNCPLALALKRSGYNMAGTNEVSGYGEVWLKSKRYKVTNYVWNYFFVAPLMSKAKISLEGIEPIELILTPM